MPGSTRDLHERLHRLVALGETPSTSKKCDARAAFMRTEGHAQVSTPSFSMGYSNNWATYQSEGLPLTGYLVPGCVGIWAWTGWENSSAVTAAAVAAAAAVAPTPPLRESNILCVFR